MRKDEVLFKDLAQSIISEDIDKIIEFSQAIKLTELYRRNDVPLHKTSMTLIKDAMCTVAKEGVNKDFFTQFVKELPSFWFNKYLKNMIAVVIENNNTEKYDQIKNHTDSKVFYKSHDFTNASFGFYSHNDYSRFHSMMNSEFLNTKDNNTIRKAIFKIACDKNFKERHCFVEDIFKKGSLSWIHGTCRNIIAYMIINRPEDVINKFFYFNEYFGKDVVQKNIIDALGEKYTALFGSIINNYELNLKLNNIKDNEKISKQIKI